GSGGVSAHAAPGLLAAGLGCGRGVSSRSRRRLGRYRRDGFGDGSAFVGQRVVAAGGGGPRAGGGVLPRGGLCHPALPLVGGGGGGGRSRRRLGRYRRDGFGDGSAFVGQRVVAAGGASLGVGVDVLPGAVQPARLLQLVQDGVDGAALVSGSVDDLQSVESV